MVCLCAIHTIRDGKKEPPELQKLWSQKVQKHGVGKCLPPQISWTPNPAKEQHILAIHDRHLTDLSLPLAASVLSRHCCSNILRLYFLRIAIIHQHFSQI